MHSDLRRCQGLNLTSLTSRLPTSPPPSFPLRLPRLRPLLSLSLSILHGGRLSRQTDPVNLASPWPFSSTLSLSLYSISSLSLPRVLSRFDQSSPQPRPPQVPRQTVKENSVQRSGGIVMTAFNVPMHAAFVIVPHRLPNLSFYQLPYLSYRGGI